MYIHVTNIQGQIWNTNNFGDIFNCVTNTFILRPDLYKNHQNKIRIYVNIWLGHYM